MGRKLNTDLSAVTFRRLAITTKIAILDIEAEIGKEHDDTFGRNLHLFGSKPINSLVVIEHGNLFWPDQSRKLPSL
jgi:hypothetical protein